MKKILIIHTALPPYRVDFFNDVARQIPGLHIFFLLGEMPCHHIPFEAFDVHFEYTIGTRKRFKQWEPLRVAIRVLPSLVKTVIKQQPGIVITSEFGVLTLLMALYCRLFRIRHIAFTDASLDNMLNDRGRKLRRELVLKMTNGLIVCNSYAKEHFQSRLPYKVESIEILQKEAVFISGLRDSVPVANEYIQQYHLLGKKVLLFVGRLVGEKNIPALIRAFARLDDDCAVLVLVGSGVLEGELRSLVETLDIANRVVFTGAQRRERLGAWYLLGGLFVLPSISEPFGAVVNEALLAGMPVLCSKYAGAACLIKEGCNGEVFNPDDAAGFARSLVSWAEELPKVVRCESVRNSLMQHRYDDVVTKFVEVCRGQMG
jgi:glycosyltransferase involved in cell wall biosynthesis